MGSVLHAFPSFHSINGRSLALAFIIVVHATFFWALSSGLRPPTFEEIKDGIFIPIDEPLGPKVEPPKTPIEKVELTRVVPDDVPVPDANYDNSDWIVADPPGKSGGGPATTTEELIAPVVVPPQIDTRRGLREPVYPPQAIRLNHTGTVLLSVEVLPSGKVGGVRVVQSSGYPRLDEAAVQAAREWRLVPGTRDGMPTAMWKQIPITFRLKD